MHTTMKKVLILGSGLVARPIIRYLLGKDIAVTVASNTPERSREMVGGSDHGTVIDWDASDEETLDNLVKTHDLVVSLLPYAFHVGVATLCIRHHKNMVTTSYVKPEMKALDQAAREAGVLILNEIGLDPGIDHMSAMRIIDHIHEKGGGVLEFYSFCGALPAPEAANNPFKYRFSWSPRGVLLAGNNDGVYLKNGKVISVPTQDLFKDPLLVDCPSAGNLEVYPNRDSLAYQDIYGIPEAKTLYRGTFRNQGWCGILDSMKHINLFSQDPIDVSGMTYNDFLKHQLTTSTPPSSIKSPRVKEALTWLGLYEDKPMSRTQTSPFDIMADLMIGKMTLNPEERDMVVMQHTFVAAYSDGRKEIIRSRMLAFGIPDGDTAVARTVALPAAMGVEMILNDAIQVKGVHIPVIPEIYNPVLDQLETMGIKMDEEYDIDEIGF